MWGSTRKPTNNNGDIHRRRIMDYISSGEWFTYYELVDELRIKYHTARHHITELNNKGLLEERQFVALGEPGRRPREFRFKDQWAEVVHSKDEVVSSYYMRMRELADIYRAGAIPTDDCLDDVITDIGDELLGLTNRIELLTKIYENPDMRNKNKFVKRMGLNNDDS
jgi:predicted ArsR family transcriptional regulator